MRTASRKSLNESMYGMIEFYTREECLGVYLGRVECQNTLVTRALHRLRHGQQSDGLSVAVSRRN